MDDLKKQAKIELYEIQLFIKKIENNNLGCHISIDGLIVGLCENTSILPALLYQKKEIIKFLNGKKNKWV